MSDTIQSIDIMTDYSLNFMGKPYKTIEELDKLYTVDTVYIIEKIMKSKREFNNILQDLIDIIKYGYQIEAVRKRPVIYKFKSTDAKLHETTLNRFVSQLIFWKPLVYIVMDERIDESWIFDFSNFNSNTLTDYINNKLLAVYNVDFASQNAMVDELYHDIVSISKAFAPLMGMSLSLYDLYQLEKRHPEISDIMRGEIDHNLPPHEIEELLSNNNKRLIDILVNDEELNDYKPFFASKSGLKVNQFKEYMVRIGFKADLLGNTIPIFIDNNFLVTGLTKPSYIYINALSGRKALILSKISMGRPGAFSKKLTYQAVTSTLREDYEMCDSVATVAYNIKDDEMLKYLNGRYYYDTQGEMQLLNYDNDKRLIGKVVQFRSPATCTSKNGVCKYCYGHLFDINKSLASAGALAAIKITGPIGQMVLSSKHSQTTSSNELKFNDGYYELFDVANSSIVLKEDSESDANLYIRLGAVTIEEMDDSEFYSTTSFDIVDDENNTVHHIEEESGAKFYLNDTLTSIYKTMARTKSNDLISLEDLADDDSLFTVEVKNKELTEPLRIFNTILNTNDHMGAEDISQICQIFAEKLLAMNIKFEFTHAEMIIRSLLRKKSNILEFPDFTLSGNPNDYQILKLNDGQLHHPSPLVSLPYGYIRRQLLSTELYKKDSTGPLDELYASTLSDFI